MRFYGVFEGCRFEHNSADLGGSVAMSNNREGVLSWLNCDFKSDRARVAGGSVWLDWIRRMALFDRCGFASSTSQGDGGAVLANTTHVRFRWSTLKGNIAYSQGGAIWAGGALSAGDVTLQNCSLWSNLAVKSGGALHVEGLTAATVVYSSLILNGNAASPGAAAGNGLEEFQGGAVAVLADSGASQSTFEDCIFQDNMAGDGGALLVVSYTTLRR